MGRTYLCDKIPPYKLFLEWEIFQKNCGENQNTHFMLKNFSFSENRAVDEIMWKNVVESDRSQTVIQYSACALHAGYLKLQTRKQNMEYLLIIHDNNGYENAPKFYFVHALSVLS